MVKFAKFVILVIVILLSACSPDESPFNDYSTSDEAASCLRVVPPHAGMEPVGIGVAAYGSSLRDDNGDLDIIAYVLDGELYLFPLKDLRLIPCDF